MHTMINHSDLSPPHQHLHGRGDIRGNHHPIESWVKEKSNFLQTCSPHLMAWTRISHIFQLIGVSAVQDCRISKAEAVYKCQLWECSGSILTMPFVLVREEMCYSHKPLWFLFVCLFLISYIMYNFTLHYWQAELFQPLFTKDALGLICEPSDGTGENRWDNWKKQKLAFIPKKILVSD